MIKNISAQFTIVAIAVAIVGLSIARLDAQNSAQATVVDVGPNVLVTTDADAPHVEMFLAADPANPKHLLGDTGTVMGMSGMLRDRTWASFDGGNTWSSATVPGNPSQTGGDPQVGFSPSGTAYAATLLSGYGKSYQMLFYRSPDGGRTWEPGVYVGNADHEQLAVDQSNGPHRGRIYLWANSARLNDNFAGLFYSDDGKRFTGPLKVGVSDHPSDNVLTVSSGLQVLNDGSIIAGYNFFNGHTSAVYVRVSRDSGKSWSVRHLVVAVQVDRTALKSAAHLSQSDMRYSGSAVSLAANAGATRFATHAYALWRCSSKDGFGRLCLSRSTDGGQIWRAPLVIDKNARATEGDWGAASAVNKNGVVGILFSRSPGVDGDPKTFDVYFTTSTDGGKTFAKPVRVSSATSYPNSIGNLRLIYYGGHSHTDLSVGAALTEHRVGGDYIGMAADSAGAFHGFWPDARTGTYLVYSAAIIVNGRERPATNADAEPQLLGDRVSVDLDSTRYDPRTKIYTLSLRLRNVSKSTITGPLTVRFARNKKHGYEGSYTILGGDNVDYTRALGTLGRLLPGEVSDAHAWRIKFKDTFGLAQAQLRFDVYGTISR